MAPSPPRPVWRDETPQMEQALYRRWRPQTWDEVVGQGHVVETLRNAVKGERVAHAYLFAGPRGTGKTTTARLLAKAANCLAESPADRPCNVCHHCRALNEGRFLDLIEIDAASNTSVEDVRDLRDKINFAPNHGRFKVYIIDEVHMLSTAAFNALLKTLEEPPAHAIFVLATTEAHKIPPTVLSRCQRHEFRRLPVDAIVEYLRAKTADEGLEVEGPALTLIARQATGSLRDAISLLDQLTSTGVVVTLAQVQEVLGTAGSEAVGGVVQALIDGEVAAGLTLINRALDGGADPRQFGRQVIDHLRSLLLIRLGNPELLDVTPESRARMERQAENVEIDSLVEAIRAFNQATVEGRSAWQLGLPLELAFIDAAAHDAPPLSMGSSHPEEAVSGSSQGTTEPPAVATPPRPREAVGPAARVAEAGGESVRRQGEPLNFQTLLDHWRDLLGLIYRRDPRTQALLNSGRPLGLKSGRLVIGFPSELLREKMEVEHNLELVRSALEAMFGEVVDVRCVLTQAWSGSEDQPPPVEDGGMVATAVRDLGAQVVDVEPLPPEEEAESGSDRTEGERSTFDEQR